MSRLRRIEWRLPLSIAGLLTAVVIGFSWAAYGEVRAAALRAAQARSVDVANRLSELVARSIEFRQETVRSDAQSPLIVEALARQSSEATSWALSVLAYQLEEDSELLGIEVWDSADRLVVEASQAGYAEQNATVRVPPEWARGDTLAVSELRSTEDGIRFAVAAAVQGTSGSLGYVVHHLDLAHEEIDARQIEGFVGSGASLSLGIPGGLWTDLSGPVEPPPDIPPDLGTPTLHELGDGSTVLGTTARVAGTPWIVWVEFPTDLVLARPRAFMSRIVPVGSLVIVLGALAGAILSQGITRRLRKLTEASEAIAAGEEGRRVPSSGDDELGVLARTFNSMATRVEDARHQLEGQVASRTAELVESEERFRALATAAPDAIVTADHRGDITYFNPGAERIFGHAPEAVLGRPLTILMPERYEGPHRRAFAAAVAAGEEATLGPLDLTGLRADGVEFPIELSVASRHHDDQLVFTSIVRDVTERNRRDRDLRRYATELEAANAELEAFSYSVSHDLRAPLRGIHGFSQAVLEDYGELLDAKGIEYLGRVCSAAEYMGQLIDDLLELSRATRSDMHYESVDLALLGERVAQELVSEEPERQVEFGFAKSLPAQADPQLLTLVLRNLLGNAWKFTKRNERARIELARRDGSGQEEDVDDHDVFVVRDDGAGFDMRYADNLFAPFQRLHSVEEFDGTGVGLALVQRIIRRHGGEVWAEGEVGKGAEFYFTLPRIGAQKRSNA